MRKFVVSNGIFQAGIIIKDKFGVEVVIFNFAAFVKFKIGKPRAVKGVKIILSLMHIFISQTDFGIGVG